MRQTTDDAKGTVRFWHFFFFFLLQNWKVSGFLNELLYYTVLSWRHYSMGYACEGKFPRFKLLWCVLSNLLRLLLLFFFFVGTQFYSTNMKLKHADSKIKQYIWYIWLFIPCQSWSSVVSYTVLCFDSVRFLLFHEIIATIWTWRYLGVGLSSEKTTCVIDFLAACSLHQTRTGRLRG